MGPVSGVVVFLLVWWVVLFTVLPLGVRQPDKPEPGMAGGAPANPNIGRKFLITTAVTIVIWCVIAYLIHIRIIDFREFARENPWWG